MIYPPVFEWAILSPTVLSLLGSNPTRLYPFGVAPQQVPVPYAVWQTIGGIPENYLGDIPDADSFRVQIDVYGRSADSVRTVAAALRDAYQSRAYIVRWGGESRDDETKNDRFSFDVDFIIPR